MARSRKEILKETTAFRQWSRRGFHFSRIGEFDGIAQQIFKRLRDSPSVPHTTGRLSGTFTAKDLVDSVNSIFDDKE